MIELYKTKILIAFDTVLFCSRFCLSVIFVVRDLPGPACTHGILSSVSVVLQPLHDAMLFISRSFCLSGLTDNSSKLQCRASSICWFQAYDPHLFDW